MNIKTLEKLLWELNTSPGCMTAAAKVRRMLTTEQLKHERRLTRRRKRASLNTGDNTKDFQ